MALTTSQFKRPTGRLSPTWFADDLDALLTALIQQAEGLTSNEAAQVAWVYHRAYQTLADDRALIAQTIAADDIRETYSEKQLAHWQNLADSMLAKYEHLTRTSAGGPVFTPVGFRK